MTTDVVKTIRASGGDYSSLSGFLAGEGRDLVAADERAVAECYNDWTGDGLGSDRIFGANGFTTNSSANYVLVRPAAGSGTQGPNKHDGTPGSGFRFSYSGSYSPAIYPTFSFAMEDVEARSTNSGGQEVFKQYGNYLFAFDRCIFYQTAPAWVGNQHNGAYGNSGVRNCLAIQTTDNGGVNTSTAGSRVLYENCTVVCTVANTSYAIAGDSYGNPVSAKNCAFIGFGMDWNGNGSWAGAGNATDQSSGASGLPGTAVSVYDLTTAAFTDAANDDYSLASGSVLIDQGVDLSADFTTDIAGTTRPQGAAFDIGAFEYLAGGGTTLALASVTHAQALAGGLGLTQAGAITPASVAHGHTLDATTLAQANTLAVQALGHTQALGSVTLTEAAVLALAGLAHAQALAGGLGLTSGNSLAPASVTHAQALAGGLGLTQAGALTVNGLTHAQTLAQAALTVGGTLTAHDLNNGHALESVSLTQQNVLAVTDALHGQALDGVPLDISVILAAVAGVSHGQALAGGLGLTQASVLTPNNLAHLQALTGFDLIAGGALNPADLRHAQTLDALNLPGTLFHTDRLLLVAESDRIMVIDAADRVLWILD